VFPLAINTYEGLARVRGLIYLQVSISGQALIFVTRARRVSWLEMPHPLVLCSFLLAQMGATFIAVYGTCLLKVQFFFFNFFCFSPFVTGFNGYPGYTPVRIPLFDWTLGLTVHY